MKLTHTFTLELTFKELVLIRSALNNCGTGDGGTSEIVMRMRTLSEDINQQMNK